MTKLNNLLDKENNLNGIDMALLKYKLDMMLYEASRYDIDEPEDTEEPAPEEKSDDKKSYVSPKEKKSKVKSSEPATEGTGRHGGGLLKRQIGKKPTDRLSIPNDAIAIGREIAKKDGLERRELVGAMNYLGSSGRIYNAMMKGYLDEYHNRSGGPDNEAELRNKLEKSKGKLGEAEATLAAKRAREAEFAAAQGRPAPEYNQPKVRKNKGRLNIPDDVKSYVEEEGVPDILAEKERNKKLQDKIKLNDLETERRKEATKKPARPIEVTSKVKTPVKETPDTTTPSPKTEEEQGKVPIINGVPQYVQQLETPKLPKRLASFVKKAEESGHKITISGGPKTKPTKTSKRGIKPFKPL